MPAICLKAHFDGQIIQLDEPYALKANTKLMVTVLVEPTTSPVVCEDATSWTTMGMNALSRAYGPAEPDYSEADLVP